MSELTNEKKFVVIPDLHGRSDLFRAVTEEYSDVQFVTLGDSIGRGPDSAGVLRNAKKTKTRLGMGNWDMYLLAGMVHHDPRTRWLAQDTKVFETEELQKMAISYGIDPKLTKQELIQKLTFEMQKRGHPNMLARAAMYFETDDFIAIHAGLTDQEWPEQKQEIAIARGTFDELPQIADDANFTLSSRQEAFKATDKIVITGHNHQISGDRVTANGKRVRLASRVNDGQPLFVWESWGENEVREFK